MECDLLIALVAKLQERPETNSTFTVDNGSQSGAVEKHLIGEGISARIIRGEDRSITIQAIDGRISGDWLKTGAWYTVSPDQPDVIWDGLRGGRRTITADTLKQIQRAIPMPPPESVYGCVLRNGEVTGIAYSETCSTAAVHDDRFRLGMFTLDGRLDKQYATPYQAVRELWRGVDGGLWRCLDEDLAAGKRKLTAAPDLGYFKLILDGREFLSAAPVPPGTGVFDVGALAELATPQCLAKGAARAVARRRAADQILSAWNGQQGNT